MGIIDLIASENFIAVNKQLARLFGLDEAIMLGELASEYNYWARLDKLENGSFFSTVDNIRENTTLSDKRQRTALKNLCAAGVVSVERKGIPAKRYIRINEEQLAPILLNNNSQNGRTRSAEMAELDTPNRQSNNNNNKNNNKNNKESKTGGFDAILSAYTQDEKTLELLGEWLKARKSKRATMTDRAIQLNIDKLDKLAAESGLSVNAYLEEILRRGWGTFYAINKYSKQSGSPAIATDNSVLDGVF